jgi:hypothetical protein
MQVPITLSQVSSKVVTIHWSTLYVPTAPNTPEPQAPASDYTAASGTLTFPAGTTTEDATFTVTGDAARQFEYVVITFNTPTNARMGGFWGLGFGLIDPYGIDPTPTVEFFSGFLAGQYPDGPYPATLTATAVLTHPTSHPVTVDWTTTEYGPIPYGEVGLVPATDYTPDWGTLTFAPGQVSASLSFDAHSNAPVTTVGQGHIAYVGIQLSNPANAELFVDPAPLPPGGALYLLGS